MQTGMQIFHRPGEILKTRKYLLITQSFPHSPQVFPQEFSTGERGCGYSFLVHIKRRSNVRQISYFSEGRVFYHGGNFVQKLGLDSRHGPAANGVTGSWSVDYHQWVARYEGALGESGFFAEIFNNSSGKTAGLWAVHSLVGNYEKTEEFFEIGG